MVNVTAALKNLDHPLYKIFGDIPAGSSDFTHASVRHYPLRLRQGPPFRMVSKLLLRVSLGLR
jgi:hypothetical protein